jgi:hypothetical protein
VDFHGKKDGIAFIRFATADGAKNAVAEVEAKKIKFDGDGVTVRILEGAVVSYLMSRVYY